MAGNIGEVNVKINVDTVDITETIRGLKAIQREAKKATQALRDLESAEVKPVYYASGLREYSTEELRMELNYREAAELQRTIDGECA
ncbi:hypothetical protein D3C87_1455090 [compost metagenome]